MVVHSMNLMTGVRPFIKTVFCSNAKLEVPGIIATRASFPFTEARQRGTLGEQAARRDGTSACEAPDALLVPPHLLSVTELITRNHRIGEVS